MKRAIPLAFALALVDFGCSSGSGDASTRDASSSCAEKVAAKGSACGVSSSLAGPTAEWCAPADGAAASCFEALDCASAASVVLTGREPCRVGSGDLVDLPKGLQPEGFTKGPGDLAYVGTLTRGAVVRVDLRTGLVDFLVAPGAKTERAIAGVTYDAAHRSLFACGAWFADGWIFDAETGETRAHVTFPKGPKGTLINAVALLGDSAWFTDSVNPRLLRLPLGADGLPAGAPVEVPLGGDFAMAPGLEVANANGVVAIPGTNRLLLLNSAKGLIYVVDADTGVAHAVDGVSVPEADGLQLDGQRLVVVQNAPENRVTVVTLDATMLHGTTTATIADARFRSPTNPVVLGDTLWVVDSRLADIFHGNAQPDDRFDAVRLRLAP